MPSCDYLGHAQSSDAAQALRIDWSRATISAIEEGYRETVVPPSCKALRVVRIHVGRPGPRLSETIRAMGERQGRAGMPGPVIFSRPPQPQGARRWRLRSLPEVRAEPGANHGQGFVEHLGPHAQRALPVPVLPGRSAVVNHGHAVTLGEVG